MEAYVNKIPAKPGFLVLKKTQKITLNTFTIKLDKPNIIPNHTEVANFSRAIFLLLS